MNRTRSTTRTGRAFDPVTIQAVWRKGRIVSGYDAQRYRMDNCGAWMDRLEYGNTQASMGWEIDHIRPVSKGGGDDLANLQPLQWANNRGKSDSWPNWSCSVSAA